MNITEGGRCRLFFGNTGFRCNEFFKAFRESVNRNKSVCFDRIALQLYLHSRESVLNLEKS